MLLFGHVGFALGATLFVNSIVPQQRSAMHQEDLGKSNNYYRARILRELSVKSWNLIKRMANWDLRFIILGSLLPDLIDKPTGFLIFRDVYSSGRLYCHTLLFVVALAIIGLFLKILYKKNYLLLIAFASLTHLILDFMWFEPRVFLWPLFGFTFEKGISLSLEQWLWTLITAFFRRPWVAIPELIGAIITVWFVWSLWRHKKLGIFMKTGGL